MTGSKEMFQDQREAEMIDLYSFLPTKANVENTANHLITQIKQGEGNGFEILARMEAVKLFCDQVRSGVEQHLRDELEKYGKEGYKCLEARFELAEVGVKYDYSTDPTWATLKTKLDTIVGEMKDREKLLKTISKPFNETNMETGEVIEVRPANKTSKSSFKITLGK